MNPAHAVGRLMIVYKEGDLTMLTLYYAPGACSMASHIGLEESGAPYETKLISFADGEQRSEAYLKINPRGRVPALSIDGAILVENTVHPSFTHINRPERFADDPAVHP